MLLDRRDSVALYIQLCELIKRQILDDGLAIGDRLPSVRALMQRHGISLPVVRQCMEVLEGEGLIRREQGRGCFVAGLPRLMVKAPTGHLNFILVGRSSLDPFFSRVLAGAEEQAAQDGFLLSFQRLGPGRHREQDHGAAGCIATGDISPAMVDDLRAAGLPFVLAGHIAQAQAPGVDISYVANDDAVGARLAVGHLIACGHRRIAMISGPTTCFFWNERIRGYREALRAQGLEVDPGLHVACAEESSEAGHAAIGRLLEGDSPPTALFAGNDRYAHGAYGYIHGIHARIPERLSIIGFDDLAFAQNLIPPLTTIHADIEQLGRESVRLLRRRMLAPPGVEGERVIMAVRLAERRSCGRPPPA